MKSNCSIPYEIIESATLEDIDAINYILMNYSRYIKKLSTRQIKNNYGNYIYTIDTELKGQLENKLIEAILLFKIK